MSDPNPFVATDAPAPWPPGLSTAAVLAAPALGAVLSTLPLPGLDLARADRRPAQAVGVRSMGRRARTGIP